ncbi:MAG: hypothetical protein Q4F43_00900 [Eubacteriales bacterium]|nr:hypothetical protein [Eubacteriales bacterium]
MDLFGKKKTKAAIDREQKEKVDLDRAHSQQIKQELNEIRMMPYRTDLAMEEINQFDSLLAQAATIADQLPPVAFDVTGIDKEILGIIEVLRHTKEDGGSRETMKRCLTGIAYGLKHGHREIPSHANAESVVNRREGQLKRYKDIVLMSAEIDKNYLEIAKRSTEKKNREGELQDAKDKLNKLVDESPAVYYKVRSLTPDERTTLTGEDYNMAAAMSSVVNRTREINHLNLLIGNSRSDIETLQTSVNSLVVQLENWERNIDEATIADIQRLTKDFEHHRLEQQQFMKKLNESTAELDSAFRALYNTLEAKEEVVTISEEYDKILRDAEKKALEDERGRMRLEEERKILNEAQQNAAEKNETKQILFN